MSRRDKRDHQEPALAPLARDSLEFVRYGSPKDLINAFLLDPAAASFATHTAAYLRALEQVSARELDREVLPSEIAGHEAGHVVVSAAFGSIPGRVQVFGGGQRLGGLTTPDLAAGPSFGVGLGLERIAKFMCLYCAGYLAERHFGRDWWHASAHDLAIAFYLAHAAAFIFPKVTAQATLRATLTVTSNILARNEVPLRTVRDRLTRRGDLDRGELVKCLARLVEAAPGELVNLIQSGGGGQVFGPLEGALAVSGAIATAPTHGTAARGTVARDQSAAIEALAQHEKVAVMFSGGKESVVIAHMLKPWREKLTLLWINTGSMFPHMAEFVHGFAAEHGYALVELHSNQAAQFAKFGWPSRLIPIYQNPEGKVMTSSWQSCCIALRTRPATDWMLLRGIKTVVHGQRAEDLVPLSFGGANEIAPVWDWTEAKIYEYIGEHGLVLPEQYSNGYRDSGECWNCTAEVATPERFRWMQRRYPELVRQVVPMLAHVYGAVNDEIGRMGPGLAAAVNAANTCKASA